MNKRDTLIFMKFLLVGCINTAVGLSTIFIFYNIADLNYWVSTFLGNLIGTMVSFYLNKNFTFRTEYGIKDCLPQFILVSITAYFISYYLGSLIMQFLGGIFTKSFFADNLSILIASGMYTIMNYWGQKNITFRIRKVINDEENT